MAKYPSDDTLVKDARKLGTKKAVANKHGIRERTFGNHLDRNPKLKGRVEKAIEEFQAERQAATATTPDEVPVEATLRQQITELESQLRQHRKGNVIDALTLERFTEAFGHVEPKYNPLAIPRSHRSEEPHEHVLLFSDAHANEVVSFEETMGLNAYDWDVMLKRMGRIQEAVLSFQENRPYPIRKLHVWSLGDGVSGHIHDELLQTNQFPHEESVVKFALDTSEWLEHFVPHYEEIVLSGVPGNHPRLAKKPTAKMAFNNSDWTAMEFVKARLDKNPAFSFNFRKAKFNEVMVCNRWRALLLHGDGVRSTMVDVPWGGIIRYLGKLARQYVAAGKPVDMFALGHWHEANAISAGGPDVKTFVNGTIKGLDEYTLQRFGGGSAPQQLLLTVHPRRGVTDLSYLDCEDKLPASERFAAAA